MPPSLIQQLICLIVRKCVVVARVNQYTHSESNVYAYLYSQLNLLKMSLRLYSIKISMVQFTLQLINPSDQKYDQVYWFIGTIFVSISVLCEPLTALPLIRCEIHLLIFVFIIQI